MTASKENLFRAKIVAIIRGNYSQSEIETIVESLIEGGVTALEITANSNGWQNHLATAAASAGGKVLLGAGTILNLEQAVAARDAGARFFVSPHFDAQLIQWSLENEIEPIPGVVTPTEIVGALRAGATIVKLFPAAHFGPAYIKALRGPLDQAEFMVTGGVDASNIRSFFEAGAKTAGIGGNLVPKTITTRHGRDQNIIRAARELFAALPR
jgi:2-dehydro-3-deoxyphosphogluconate aldolase/(4S)-4-hydroxy-2-oxoglutarate aldolase